MDIIDSPFIKFSPDDIPRPWLPVTITNPHTKQSISLYGLIDTGADECPFLLNLHQRLGII